MTRNMSLQSFIVRLASKNPLFRQKLITALSGAIRVGETRDYPKTQIRLNRKLDSLRVINMVNAGKKGKKVSGFAIMGLNSADDKWVDEFLRAMEYYAKETSTTFVKLFDTASLWITRYPDPTGQSPTSSWQPGLTKLQDQRGVDVLPLGSETIRILTKEIEIKANLQEFMVSNRKDSSNRDMCVARGKDSVPLFFAWVRENKASIERMTFNQVVRSMDAEGIDFEQYCAS